MKLENFEVMYFHGMTVDHTRFTIAGTIHNDDLIMGISICSKEDSFVKNKGRVISSGRLLNQRSTVNGKRVISLYSHNLEDIAPDFVTYKGVLGFPVDYFVGREIKVFRSFVKNYNFFTKKELQKEFGL